MHSTNSIYQQLSVTLVQINGQIKAVSELAESNDIEPHELKTIHGEFALTPLLLAKANVLNGMALLKTSKPKP